MARKAKQRRRKSPFTSWKGHRGIDVPGQNLTSMEIHRQGLELPRRLFYRLHTAHLEKVPDNVFIILRQAHQEQDEWWISLDGAITDLSAEGIYYETAVEAFDALVTILRCIRFEPLVRGCRVHVDKRTYSVDIFPVENVRMTFNIVPASTLQKAGVETVEIAAPGEVWN